MKLLAPAAVLLNSYIAYYVTCSVHICLSLEELVIFCINYYNYCGYGGHSLFWWSKMLGFIPKNPLCVELDI